MEHRWGQRVSTQLSVQLECGPHGECFTIVQGRLTNLSVSGAFIETDFQLPSLTGVQVAIEWISRRGAERHRIRGFVTRSNNLGIGIEWSQLAPRCVVALLGMQNRRLHARNKADSNYALSPMAHLRSSVIDPVRRTGV